ncbi:MAG: GIY-YIG nuclease family protein [Clostridia bacterium]|nr:GIY-YIG nuclease family protein [Clostridia bacterium]
MAKGLLYFARNSAFQHLIKIGKTTMSKFEDRGLSSSNVPEPFEAVAIFECEDVDWAEKKLHEQFKEFRYHSLRWNKTTEFFWVGCIEQAQIYAKDLRGVKEITNSVTEEIETTSITGEKRTQRMPNTTFEMVRIPVGSMILFDNDSTKAAIVKDDKNKVEYKNKIYTLSQLASEFGGGGRVSGSWYFFYNGKRIWELRPDQQENND